MKVLKKIYNVMLLDVGEITSGEAKVIGTNQDYEELKKIANKSGLIRVQAVMSDLPICGTGLVNPWMLDDKLEVTFLTNAGYTLQAIVATIEPSDDGMKVTVTPAVLATVQG